MLIVDKTNTLLLLQNAFENAFLIVKLDNIALIIFVQSFSFLLFFYYFRNEILD